MHLFRLTTEQRTIAESNQHQSLYVEAHPGAGKTTVAAARFGVTRFTPGDQRAVVATSFTRAATSELRYRVAQEWGLKSLSFPNRIQTLDAVLNDVLAALLRRQLLHWPGDATELEVLDSWDHLGGLAWTNREPRLTINGDRLGVGYRSRGAMGSHPSGEQYLDAIERGICSHSDVRRALALSLRSVSIQEAVADRLQLTVRELIVDEVFDANPLDLAILQLAHTAGVRVIAIGDPWQALYAFRGATPGRVSDMITSLGFHQLPLSASFRFETQEQKRLARNLRAGNPVSLRNGEATRADVVLAPYWKQLWQVDEALPLALGSYRGSVGEAIATLLLDSMTKIHLGVDAVFLGEALRTLQIDPMRLRTVEGELARVLDQLRNSTERNAFMAWDSLVTSIRPLAGIAIPPRRSTSRLLPIRRSLLIESPRVPGYTVHQAKGREWPVVKVCLDPRALAHLDTGLTNDTEPERVLYVALTRAKRLTVSHPVT